MEVNASTSKKYFDDKTVVTVDVVKINQDMNEANGGRVSRKQLTDIEH